MTIDLRHQDRDRLLAQFAQTRAQTERLAARLSADDQQLQSMPDASPTKWHRAHTTWFFETFVLGPGGRRAGRRPVRGPLQLVLRGRRAAARARPKRGLLSRPTAAEVGEYRAIVDARVAELLREGGAATLDRVAARRRARDRARGAAPGAAPHRHPPRLLGEPAAPVVPCGPRPGATRPASATSPLRASSRFDGGLREIGAGRGEPVRVRQRAAAPQGTGWSRSSSPIGS